jgi:hypothetical protein
MSENPAMSHEKREDCAESQKEALDRLRGLEREVEGMIREWRFARLLIVIMFPVMVAAGWGIASKWWEVSAQLARIEARLDQR